MCGSVIVVDAVGPVVVGPVVVGPTEKKDPVLIHQLLSDPRVVCDSGGIDGSDTTDVVMRSPTGVSRVAITPGIMDATTQFDDIGMGHDIVAAGESQNVVSSAVGIEPLCLSDTLH